ncbi:MAG: DNA polymerase III subunit [Elusimicrobia bacterium]|nr:DNA polymerase III subunit [Elusimicrobiota bacterium]
MSFKDIINQEKAKNILIGQLNSKKISHAYLFLGQDGIGRKKTAYELAKALNCPTNSNDQKFNEGCDHCLSCDKIKKLIHPDVQHIGYEWQANLLGEEIDKQKSIKIKTIRALQYEINLKPSESRWKIFIIEPAEEITEDAANCLLKTLEEPPKWTVIILLAKHKENLPSTVVSRTQIVPFQPLSEKEISNFLISNHNLAKGAADNIAVLSEGSLSSAIRLIEEKKTIQSPFWPKVKQKKIPVHSILEESDNYTKNASELLEELLAEVKNDFRSNPQDYQSVIREIINSQKLIEQNVNSRFVLDALFLKINRLVNVSDKK